MKSFRLTGFLAANPINKSRMGKGFAPSFLPSFLILIAILLLLGCKKEQESQQSKSETQALLKDSEEIIQVTDGVLCFLDMPSFEYYLNSLLAMPDSLRKLQEVRWGFTSYATITDSLSDIVFNASTKNEMLQLISSYNDFVKVADSTVTTQLPFYGHQCVANIHGIFKVGNTFFRIFPEGIVGWTGATLTQIKSLTLNEDFDDDLSDGKFFYIKNVELDPIESNCGNYKRVEKYTNGNTYRVIFDISTYKIHYASSWCTANNTPIEYVFAELKLRIVGQRKRFGIWNSYITNLEYKDIYCEIEVPRQDHYISQTCTSIIHTELGGISNKSGYKGSSRGWVVYYSSASNGMGDMTANININDFPTPTFLKVKGKAKSDALGINNWAEISCGY